MANQKKVTILLADDHPIVTLGVKTELEKIKDFKVVGEAKSGREAIAKSIKLKPDVILLDISMPDINGLEAMSVMAKKVRESKIIALSMHNNEKYIEEIVKQGAKGYILKDSPPEEIVFAIREVLKGKNYFDKIISKNVKTAKSAKRIGKLSSLTKRELEILQNISDGLNNKAIAGKFFISVRTVESHRDSIKKKLGIKSVAELTKYSLKNNSTVTVDKELPEIPVTRKKVKN